MFKKQFLLLLVLAVPFLSQVQAQSNRVGFVLKPTLTHMVNEIMPSKINPSLSAGLAYDHNLVRQFYFKTGLYYERKGCRAAIFVTDSVFNTGINEVKSNLHYLTLPLQLSVATRGKVKFYADGGVYLGFLLFQQTKYKDTENFHLENTNETASLNRFDLGIDAGFGFLIPVGEPLLLDIGLQSQFGLREITKIFNFPYYGYTRSIGLKVGVRYTLEGE